MTISFKARVLIALGADLISSDAVALYELVKNGIDAGSRKKIEIHVQVVIQPSAVKELCSRWSSCEWNVDEFLADVQQYIEDTDPDVLSTDVYENLGRPKSRSDGISKLKELAFEYNTIKVSDWGHGMSVPILQSAYLTVATPMRLLEREQDDSGIPPLGEKGLGRFAAMRLGRYVQVMTGVAGQTHWNRLIMDWRPAFEDPNLDADQLVFKPRASRKAKNNAETGTHITIRDLQSDWSVEKIRALCESDLAKVADPFRNNFANQFMNIYFQGEKQEYLVGFPGNLLKKADAFCEIKYTAGETNESSTLEVSTTYSFYKRSDPAQLITGEHLLSCVSYPPKRRRKRADDRLPDSDEVIRALKSLGSFSARLHWYNRGRLQRDENELWETVLKDFVRVWSGGLLVYRDGFRVYPYGSPADDWLDLDRVALSSSAYKLNRAQIVGYLRIGSAANPQLQDQTNREGFRDCPEKEALRRLLRHAIISICKPFLESVTKELKQQDGDVPEDTAEKIDERIVKSRKAAQRTIGQLLKRVPDESTALQSLLDHLEEIESAWERAKATIAAHDDEIEQYFHLAGVGLMVEIVAHELARGTETALDLLRQKGSVSAEQLESLRAQLLTLNRRVRVLDEISVPGRQRKMVQDIGKIVDLATAMYETKAARHGVEIRTNVVGQKTLRRKVEKGQMVQIFGNLLANSMYWLSRQIRRKGKPRITITVDVDGASVTVSDNGPGIDASMGERVFRPLQTTRTGKEPGRGLGLTIASQYAQNNDATLELLPAENGTHRGFILSFKEPQKP